MRGGPGVDRIVHQEMFDLGQLDMARTRFDELEAEAGARDAVPTVLPPRVNNAVRLAKRITFFDPDQLHEALDLLDTCWVETRAPEALANAGVAMRSAYRLGSPAMLRSVLSDDFRRIDHRRLGTGTCSADEMAATLEPLGEVGGVDLTIAQCIEHPDRVSLVVTDFLASDGSTWSVLSVSVVDADLITHLEIFDPDQLDHALELFHCLTMS